jgi:prolyl 4-hydroxylase
MNSQPLNEEWKEWVKVNIDRGCSLELIYSIYMEACTAESSELEQTIAAFKEKHKTIPVYTEEGFIKEKADPELLLKVQKFYSRNLPNAKLEHVEGGFVHNMAGDPASETVELSEELRKEIQEELKPKAEEWAGVLLFPTYVYGLRVYTRGAVLEPHRDREETHIIGAILNIEQQSNVDWPLEIEDHAGKNHSLVLKPGDIVFYESALLKHGRPVPFKGDRFVNVFCHFMPRRLQETLAQL